MNNRPLTRTMIMTLAGLAGARDALAGQWFSPGAFTSGRALGDLAKRGLIQVRRATRTTWLTRRGQVQYVKLTPAGLAQVGAIKLLRAAGLPWPRSMPQLLQRA